MHVLTNVIQTYFPIFKSDIIYFTTSTITVVSEFVGHIHANVATLLSQTHCCHLNESSEYKGSQSHRHRYHRIPQNIEGVPFRHKKRVLCRDNVSIQAHSYRDQLPRRFLHSLVIGLLVRFVNCSVAFVDFRLCFFNVLALSAVFLRFSSSVCYSSPAFSSF